MPPATAVLPPQRSVLRHPGALTRCRRALVTRACCTAPQGAVLPQPPPVEPGTTTPKPKGRGASAEGRPVQTQSLGPHLLLLGRLGLDFSLEPLDRLLLQRLAVDAQATAGPRAWWDGQLVQGGCHLAAVAGWLRVAVVRVKAGVGGSTSRLRRRCARGCCSRRCSCCRCCCKAPHPARHRAVPAGAPLEDAARHRVRHVQHGQQDVLRGDVVDP
jgi:hypothetical protein